jgi:glycosyltransferase involved in cell wall biosynthesis
MKKFPKISIALTTFNGEKYLVKLLESFLSQTQSIDEVIICDDGSSDKTIEILNNFKANHREINFEIFENHSNLGVVKNFSKAIRLCKGDLIFLADQDDVWEVNKVKVMVGEYIKGTSSYIISDMKVMDAEGNLESFTFSEFCENEYFISRSYFMNGCAVLAAKHFLLACLPVPPGKAHDSWFAYCARRLKTRLYLSEPLMRYRIHSDGLTSKNWANRRMVQKSVSKLEKHNNLFTLIRTPRPHLLILTKVNMHLYFLVVKVKWFFYA